MATLFQHTRRHYQEFPAEKGHLATAHVFIWVGIPDLTREDYPLGSLVALGQNVEDIFANCRKHDSVNPLSVLFKTEPHIVIKTASVKSTTRPFVLVLPAERIKQYNTDHAGPTPITRQLITFGLFDLPDKEVME